METLIDQTLVFLKTMIHPDLLEAKMRTWGWLSYPILSAIVFAETGILAGFFFPGDSLLFIAGFVAGLGYIDLGTLNICLIIAAIAGDTFGFYLGTKTGPRVFQKTNSLFFKQDYLKRTQQFYEKHGGKTIILARFIPIIRTFAPFMAGVGKMNYRKFIAYNVFGGIGWVFSMTLLGYFLGNIPWVKANLEKAILLIIFLSLLPVIHQALKRGSNESV